MEAFLVGHQREIDNVLLGGEARGFQTAVLQVELLVLHLVHGECLVRFGPSQGKDLVAGGNLAAERHIMAALPFLRRLLFSPGRRNGRYSIDDVLANLVEALALSLELTDAPVLVADASLGLLEPALRVNYLLLQFRVPFLEPLYIVALVI